MALTRVNIQVLDDPGYRHNLHTRVTAPTSDLRLHLRYCGPSIFIRKESSWLILYALGKESHPPKVALGRDLTGVPS